MVSSSKGTLNTPKGPCMDITLLHRIQFGLTITPHFIFASLSMGLSLFLVLFHGLYWKTSALLWKEITQFWMKIFSFIFALGIATGIPMAFAFGTNWSAFTQFVGDVVGGVFVAEALFAFAIEAIAFGFMVYGWKKVSKNIHFLSTIMVCVGAHLSAFWILSIQSWMNSPQGFTLVSDADGRLHAELTQWGKMVFNPLTIPHFLHVILGTTLTGSFLITSVSLFYLIQRKWLEYATPLFRIGNITSVLTLILLLISSDYLGKTIARENPIKLAAFEGQFQTKNYAPVYLFGSVNESTRETKGVSIPGLLSLLAHNDPSKEVSGLDQAPSDEWPNVPLVFHLYHIMIWTWVLMLCAAGSMWYMRKKELYNWSPNLMKLLMASAILPHIGNIMGWYSSCIGRQPWIVYKLLRTKTAISSEVPISEVSISLILFLILYSTLLFLLFVFLKKSLKDGPKLSQEVYTDHGQ